MDKRIEDIAARLEAVAKERKFFISADGRISEIHAAELIGMAAGTLKNMRSAGLDNVVTR